MATPRYVTRREFTLDRRGFLRGGYEFANFPTTEPSTPSLTIQAQVDPRLKDVIKGPDEPDNGHANPSADLHYPAEQRSARGAPEQIDRITTRVRKGFVPQGEVVFIEMPALPAGVESSFQLTSDSLVVAVHMRHITA